MKFFLSALVLGFVAVFVNGQYRRHPLDKGVRFGHQNPIKVAPTLPPIGGGPTATYSYEQPYVETTTRKHHHHVQKASGCTDEFDRRTGNRIVSRLDRNTQQCFPLGSAEPCGGSRKNMVFHAVSDDDVHGECDCNQNGSGRPLVYHPETDTCYYAYQRGYCAEEEWLIFESTNYVCKPNPCRNYGSGVLNWDWNQNSDMLKMNTKGIVPFFDKMICVPLSSICRPDGKFTEPWMSEGDESSRSSDETSIVGFQKGDLQAKCHKKKDIREAGDKGIFHTSSGPQLVMECRPGSKLDVIGKC